MRVPALLCCLPSSETSLGYACVTTALLTVLRWAAVVKALKTDRRHVCRPGL